jgi:hypothetical protein
MKILKYLGLGLGAVVALILITGFFLPKEYALSRTVTIHRSNADVYNYVKYLKNQANYNVWAQMDPNQITTYTGED